MSAILIAILAVAAISIALHPVFNANRETRATVNTPNPTLEHLLSARESIYSAIKDLETDHSLGKLSNADYAELRAKYEDKALTILRKLDDVQTQAEASAQAAALKRARPNLSVLGRVCGQCGAPNAEGAKFCRRCGTALASVCPSCGAPVGTDARFCRRCGSPVTSLQPA